MTILKAETAVFDSLQVLGLLALTLATAVLIWAVTEAMVLEVL